MNTRFSAHQTKSVVAFKFEGGAFDARYIAGRFIFYGDFEAFALRISQVLPHEHAGPIASFGAPCACLNVDEGIALVGFIVEHAPEFELLHNA